MEFFLVPLVAIAAVTFFIYKLAELVFHIHLSCRLLLLLVGFAWLISLVLPGLFFHSAGFLGSVGISLVSAVGFAWLATTYDTRTQASHSIIALNALEPAEVEAAWTPPAEAAFPAMIVREELEAAVEAIPFPTMEPELQIDAWSEPPMLSLEFPPEQSDLSPQISWTSVVPELEQLVATEPKQEDFSPLEEVTVEEPKITEPLAEELTIAADMPEKQVIRPDIISVIVPEAAEMEIAAIEQLAQPVSDSLEDLLEFAFAQRSQQQTISALETFRLIKHLYTESDALPMVVAEIVSTLQSQGDYTEAIAELAEILQLPEIQRQDHLVQVFEQKMTELQTSAGNVSG
ncbi:MAG TPA: hypothetical protein VN631_05975 [Negativicutes bacterium]|nr:hypothetical protein [Negativicutes bacterium]